MYLLINLDEIALEDFKDYLPAHPEEINKQNEKGWTALIIACRNASRSNYIEVIRLLLQAGADVNLQDKDGWTALMSASRYSNTDSNNETVKLLLQAGANVNLQNKFGLTAVKFASECSDDETVKLLEDYNSRFYKDNINPQLRQIISSSQGDLNDIIFDYKTHKRFMKRLIKEIKIGYNEMFCHPDNPRTQLLALKWDSNKLKKFYDIETKEKLQTRLNELNTL